MFDFIKVSRSGSEFVMCCRDVTETLKKEREQAATLDLANQQRHIKVFGDMVNAALWREDEQQREGKNMWICPKCRREFKRKDQSHYCGEKPRDIEAYIREQEEGKQAELFRLLDTLRTALPGAEERMTWSMPTFFRGRNLIHFAAFKNHIGLYPGEEAIEAFAGELGKYKTEKGTVRIPYGQTDPDMIARIARWCLENAADE